MRVVIAMLIMFLNIGAVLGQSQKQYINRADKLYEAGVWIEAAPMYLTILQQEYDSEMAERLADCYVQLNDVSSAVWWISTLESTQAPDSARLFKYAGLLKKNSQYLLAKQAYLKYAQYDPIGYYFAGTCDYAAKQELKENVLVESLSINTPDSEITPALMKNGLFFSSNSNLFFNSNNDPGTGKNFYNIFFVVKSNDGKLSKPSLLKKLNSSTNDAAPFYTTDSNRLFFTRNDYYKKRERKGKDSQVHLNIYQGRIEEGQLKGVTSFEWNCKEYSTAHPFVTEDGQLMLFASDMPGGYGGSDLYYVTKSEEGWSTPVNMGPTINTSGNEFYPFITSQNQLWFSSDYHPGLGGLDIFYSNRENGHWSKPTNAGKPINSSFDDFSAIFYQSEGYFSSNRTGGEGGDDIYRFTIMKPLSGLHLINSKQQPVAEARVILFENDHRLEAGNTDTDGYISLPLIDGNTYTVSVQKEGYLELFQYNLESFMSNTGTMTVYMQELYGVNEDPVEEDSVQFEFTDTIPDLDTMEFEDDAVYSVYVGTFKSPDYTKLTSLARFGELNVKSGDEGQLIFYVTNIIGRAKAEEALTAALSAGFSDAEIEPNE